MNKLMPKKGLRSLEYRKTRQWLLFWVLTFFAFCSLFYIETSEFEMYVGSYIFFIYPLYCIFCFFRTIGIWLQGEEEMEGYSSKFRPVRLAKNLIDSLESGNLKPKQRKKLESRLNALVTKYQSNLGTGSVKELKQKYKKQNEDYKIKEARWSIKNADKNLASIQEQTKVMDRGIISSKIKCPHCHEVGKVRKKIEKNIEETSEKGLIGALIGKKMVTDKGDITKFYCDNCQTPWTA